MPWLLLFGAIGLGVYLWEGKQASSHYKIKFLDAYFDSKGTAESYYSKLKFVVKIQVQNNTDFAGKLNSMKLGFFHNKKLLGSVSKDTPIDIKKNGLTVVEVPVAIPMASLISAETELISILKSGGGKVLTFRLVGILKFGIGTLKVNENYQVKL